ncbi:WhiB family transcriptional regulator [Arthrobacter sp. AL12]|uniref:WhiB family transcriptional regulator n=1 Tax=Arthrobacter sp. AL12 TaxID=3042241 RepID=UPI00249C9812|nr:WhiB family transcriptional regulator [Arthrobacter sp. AL12]MDI3211793.1 WhiB family transcriptional regulator [Arthrobacter sp. AL12]
MIYGQKAGTSSVSARRTASGVSFYKGTGMTSERYPDLTGGACTELAPGIAEKYFEANAHTESFLAKTAKAICARCVIQPQCLEAALKRSYPERGVVGGMSASSIRAAKEWDAYDKGLRGNPPKQSRPEMPNYYQSSPASEFATELRRQEELTFEERVYGVFLDVKSGKYEKLNQAIAEIALIHSQIVENMTS